MTMFVRVHQSMGTRWVLKLSARFVYVKSIIGSFSSLRIWCEYILIWKLPNRGLIRRKIHLCDCGITVDDLLLVLFIACCFDLSESSESVVSTPGSCRQVKRRSLLPTPNKSRLISFASVSDRHYSLFFIRFLITCLEDPIWKKWDIFDMKSINN